MPGTVSTIWRMYGMQSRIKKNTGHKDNSVAIADEHYAFFLPVLPFRA